MIILENGRSKDYSIDSKLAYGRSDLFESIHERFCGLVRNWNGSKQILIDSSYLDQKLSGSVLIWIEIDQSKSNCIGFYRLLTHAQLFELKFSQLSHLDQFPSGSGWFGALEVRSYSSLNQISAIQTGSRWFNVVAIKFSSEGVSLTNFKSDLAKFSLV